MFDSSKRRKVCQKEGKQTKKINHLIHCRALPQWNVMLLMMFGLKPKKCNSCTCSKKAISKSSKLQKNVVMYFYSDVLHYEQHQWKNITLI